MDIKVCIRYIVAHIKASDEERKQALEGGYRHGGIHKKSRIQKEKLLADGGGRGRSERRNGWLGTVVHV